MPPRSRNFNGCWTCRIRKIKCDATRPKCQRCQKANLECKGYKVVLAWADVSTLDNDNKLTSLNAAKLPNRKYERASLRRNLELVKFPKLMLYETYDKLNQIVAQFDETHSTVLRPCFIVGPFGVFPLETSSQLPLIDHSPKDLNSLPQESALAHTPAEVLEKETGFLSAVSVSEVLGSDLESSIFSKTTNAYVHYKLLDYAKLTILSIKGPRHKFNEQGMFHILYPKFFPNVESDNWRPNGRVLNELFSQDSAGNIVIAPSMGSDFKFLLDSLLSSMRVAHNQNPWKSLVVPFIKQMFFEIICEEYPESNSWKNHLTGKTPTAIPRNLLLRNIKFSIFCMCLSISWHERSLSGLKVTNAVDSLFVNDELKISIELRKIAINILNYHLDEYDGNSEYYPVDDYDTYFLLALILQVHIDNLFGVFENYELMYAIGDFILKKPKSSRRHQSSLQRHLRHSFNILNILYESTQTINFFNYSISGKDQRLKYLDLDEDYDLTKNDTNKEKDFSSDDSEEDFGSGDDDESAVNVCATSSTSQALSFTVNFDGEKPRKSSNNNDLRQPKELGFKSFQEGLPDKGSYPNPIIPTLEDGSIFLSYGLPKALLQLVQEVVHLTNHKAVFKTRGLAPRNFPRICAEIEDKILNFNVENHWKLYDNHYNPITNVATKFFISDFHEGLFHNVIYFHNALVVYFKRLIPESPKQIYQPFIQASFFHMEKLIALNKTLKVKGINYHFNPLFWPLLVCGCEIDLSTHGYLREQCQKLWNERCFKRFNYWRSKQILFEVWHRREQGEDTSFMDLIREWGIVLSLG
ncbi:hypothetical protein METBIDRAFT_33673 [Metschnikowia bicuspidata var. bicuspidata NRRL YB-4993]|uniref:Zn(2)-C6 fungal-type domain-containing protein n=1 Tax=Metschnikowia bicuspidata var. bicuspidata NRRL YB-4993 TaxID=869754 RepID=A0A1A0H4U3_9ASCO|nr:hypothetical protein METBIDRAFT_33673 [Metschnikowia bicuspidata var. bicuspidata NRRL YB-4993]OBA19056.1 hypothetical protein METBIDRAFT_33673 [Metschnikowia bicuspidata var. bicuspidata NRRL YB-4993]